MPVKAAPPLPGGEAGVPLRIGADAQRRLDAFLSSPGLPGALEDLILRYIEKKVQKRWDDPVVLERIRRAIVFQKGRYWDERPGRGIPYGKAYRTFGYLAYHMPACFVQTEHLLLVLAESGLLKPQMRVLDVGTGPGVVPLAVADFFRLLGAPGTDITIDAIERDEEHIEAYRFLVPAYAESVPGITIQSPIQADIRSIPAGEIPAGIDLMIFSNVLNELRELDRAGKADLVMRFASRLAPDGTILVVEPADRVNSTGMRGLALALKGRGLTIHSPCSFIWGAGCRPESCWSFLEKPQLAPPRLMQALADGEEAYRYLNTDIKYSYVVLRSDAKVRIPYRVPPHAKSARFSSLRRHLDRRINVVAAVMSRDLGDRLHHVVKLCDGTAVNPVFAVLPRYHRTRGNELLLKAGYGEILALRNVLVRFNEKERAFNLLVTRESDVMPIEGGGAGTSRAGKKSTEVTR
jgi:SAM-dependent methyltransferase